jgi:formate C-acetyltransferase
MTEGGELAFGEGFIAASILFQAQSDGGYNIGATPDGRHAHEPLADSLAAIFGKDKYGPTALLNSVTALDLKSALGTPVVNFNLTQRFDERILKGLTQAYISKGGMQLQISCVDKETLHDAYEHPENHANLIVRVGGFSEYFTRLSPALKRMIIDRTVQKL